MRVRVRPVLVAVSAAVSMFAVYLVLVVVATPTIPSALALRLAISANWPYLVVITGLLALQAYLYVYGRRLSYRLGITSAVGTSGSLFTSFTSFFGLTSVGCCGLLPLWVSLALGGGAIGAGASTFLVSNSAPLTILGAAVMGVSTFFGARSIRKSVGRVKQVSAQASCAIQALAEAKTRWS